MNPTNSSTKQHMHFKAAQISAAELSPNDMAMINAYALAPLTAEDVFAFKVSMAGNEIDRDHEVFPIDTLRKFANLFVGRTVVKDHDHRSDNQIARIYATNLVEGDPMHMTKNGEVYTELIAKCYMVKTSTNADLIAEIQAGIRKEVSLGCRIGKAVCSVCGTDNVKTYCSHFPGKDYKGETCYFSLEDPMDAYELSFVAIPAQQHAGTVKAYGDKPCSQAEAEPKEKEVDAIKAEEQENRLTVNQEGEKRLTVNRVEEEPAVEKEAGETQATDSQEDAPIAEKREATSKALDDFADKLKHMWERLDALGESLEKIEATIDEITSKNAEQEPESQPESPEVGEEPVEDRLTVDQEDENRLTVNQVADEREEPDAAAAEEPTEGESAPEQDAKEPEPRQEPQDGGSESQDDPENQDTSKEKQAQARLRALELALAIRNRT